MQVEACIVPLCAHELRTSPHVAGIFVLPKLQSLSVQGMQQNQVWGAS